MDLSRKCRDCAEEGEPAGYVEINATTKRPARHEFYNLCRSHSTGTGGDDDMVKFQVVPRGQGGGAGKTPFLNGKGLATLGGVGDALALSIKGTRMKPMDPNAKFVKPPVPGPPQGPADQTFVVDGHIKGPRGEGDYTVILSMDAFNVLVTELGGETDSWNGKSVPGIVLPAPGGSYYARWCKDNPYWAEQDRYFAGVRANGQGQQSAPQAAQPAAPSQPATPAAPASPTPEERMALAERMLAEAKARQEAAEAAEARLKPLPVEPAPRSHKPKKGKK